MKKKKKKKKLFIYKNCSWVATATFGPVLLEEPGTCSVQAGSAASAFDFPLTVVSCRFWIFPHKHKRMFFFLWIADGPQTLLIFYAPWSINISWCQGVSESEVCRDRFPAVQEGGTLCMPNAKARTTSLSVKTGWETIGHSCKPQTIHKRCLYRACLCALCRSSPLCSLYWAIKERRLKSPAFVGDDVLLSTLCMMLQFLIIASEIKYFGLL